MSKNDPLSIVHLISGAGGMYCGSCMHGNTLAAALMQAGHDVVLMPLYTPLRTDEESVSQQRLAFGGLNVYLQQKFSFFRKTPAFIDRLLDRPGLVRWLSRWAGKTDAAQLGALTVSMLQGQSGRQSKELEKLLELLAAFPRIDVIHLSNVLLAGLAGPIRARLNVPVVASLTGEDIFFERLPEPYAAQTRTELQRCAGQLDALVAMSGYFADRMANYLAVSREDIHVIPPGIKLAGYAAQSQVDPAPKQSAPQGDLRIGYFSRICHDKGLHLLVDALEILATQTPDCRFTLEAAGYLGLEDRGYLRDIERRFKAQPLRGRFRYVGSPDRAGKTAFLQSLDVVCLPSVFPESKGIAALEAWANGRPVIVPRAGTFPELVADTGGGILFEPANAESLAQSIRELANNRNHAEDLGRRAIQAVRKRYPDTLMAERTAHLYRTVVDTKKQPTDGNTEEPH